MPTPDGRFASITQAGNTVSVVATHILRRKGDQDRAADDTR